MVWCRRCFLLWHFCPFAFDYWVLAVDTRGAPSSGKEARHGVQAEAEARRVRDLKFEKVKTEGEALVYNVSDLLLLSTKDARKIRQIFKEYMFRFLGDWKLNVTFLKELNKQLVREKRPVIIDGFLDATVANRFYNDMVWLGESGDLKLENGSVTFVDTPVKRKAYAKASDPAARCKVMADAVGPLTAIYHYHRWKPVGNPDHLKLKGLMETVMGLQTKPLWRRAINLLLSGSGLRVLNNEGHDERMSSPVIVSELAPGDFQLFHSDMPLLHDQRAATAVREERGRTLSLNYWSVTPGWQQDWGGNFLWCGAPKTGSTRPFPEAARYVPEFNRAILFVPHSSSFHAVERVENSKKQAFHRFALSSFLEVRHMDLRRHEAAFFMKKREEL